MGILLMLMGAAMRLPDFPVRTVANGQADILCSS
jgi:hypothetical protein